MWQDWIEIPIVNQDLYFEYALDKDWYQQTYLLDGSNKNSNVLRDEKSRQECARNVARFTSHLDICYTRKRSVNHDISQDISFLFLTTYL
jgi:hypothetical protein